MDTGDSGHSAWFQSRVQVLVRSLRAHQGGCTSPQWSEHLKEVGEPSTSTPSQRRSLQLGRSLASRWHQYSPGPLRRLKKLFSAPSEREHGGGWDSDGDDVRKEQADGVDINSYVETCPLLPGESPVATCSKDTSGFEADREPQQDINSSLSAVHQNPCSEELVVSDHPVKCSQNLPNKSSSDSSNIPDDSLRESSYHKANDSHSKTSVPVPVTEDAHIPQTYGSHGTAPCVPGNSDTGKLHDVACSTSILQQQHDFSKQFYVLTAFSEDGDDEYRECWRHGAMTQWRRTDSEAGIVERLATVAQEGTTDFTVAEKGFAVCQGQFGAVDIGDPEAARMATFVSGKFDEEVKALLKTSTETVSLGAVPEVACSGVTCNTAQNVREEFSHKLDDSACDKTVEGMPGLATVVHESSVVVTKPDMETSVVVCDVDETDRSPLPAPNIVLDVSHPNTSSEATSAHSQELHRPPKLQLQIATTCSQSAARKSPVTVQEWIDALPLNHRSEEEGGEDQHVEEPDYHLDLGLGAEAGLLYDTLPSVTVVSPAEPHPTTASASKVTSAAHLAREPSVQSDVTSHTGSHCSSVESYLESRRPDPEEILLGLGFGGPVGGAGGVDTELSRIPRRFLQPSKVRGVAIDDFLRYQQDLIETFESGFCGYRGLTGSSHTTPSVIVAKIMEKLREHERENIPPSSVVSAPVIGNTGTLSLSPPTASSKFSRAARRILTRTTVLSALPCNVRQQQQQSVLTPDNRRFLDNQGSKSPEVPRKRMIIGQRSYTFGCDGDLIEVDPVSPSSTTPNIAPKPKPLLHKDSVLSTATSLSFTSIDSDSDTDDQSSIFEIQPRQHVVHDHPTTSTPKSTYVCLPNVPQNSLSEKAMTQKVYPLYPVVSKRMSSTSLSSWESEVVLSPRNSSSDVHLGVSRQCAQETVTEYLREEDGGGLKMAAKHYGHFRSIPDGPFSVPWPLRYESIDEDVEMKSDKSASLLSASASGQLLDMPSKENVDTPILCRDSTEKQHRKISSDFKTENRDVSDHVDHKSGNLNGSEVGNAVDSNSDVNNIIGQTGVQKSTKTVEEQMQIQKEVISLLQVRRGSLKRQKRILDDESLEACAKNSSELMMENEITSDMSHKETQSLALDSDDAKHIQDVKDSTDQECICDTDVFIDETSPLNNSRKQELGSHKISCVRNAEAEHAIESIEVVEMVQRESHHLAHRVGELSSNVNSASEQIDAEVQMKYAENMEEPQNTDLLQVSGVDNRGDSFEMEEICTCGEEEGHMTVLSRAWSDSSGFLDGDSEIYLSRQNGNNTDSAITNLESSQHGGSSRTSSEAAQMAAVARGLISQGDLEVTNVSSYTPSDILKSELVVSMILDNEKSESVECTPVSSLTSPTGKYAQRREIGSSAINHQNLPKNLFQELSSVNDWFCKCNVPSFAKHVCDLSDSCAVLHECQRSLANVSIAGVCEENSSTAEEATTYSFPVSNKAVPCGKSAINPGVQNVSTPVSQDSSSYRALGYHIPLQQSLACTDDDNELARHRTMSLHSIDHKNVLNFGGVRRVKSAPQCLEHMPLSDDVRSNSWSSVSNMFSFCSDESVINVGLQKTGLGRTNEKRLSDVCASGLYKSEVMEQHESGFSDVDGNSSKHLTDSTSTTQYLKPCALSSGRNTRKSSSDAPPVSNHSVTGLHELVGELANRGWDISVGTESSNFACHTELQLLHLQGDAVRAGLAAYGRQLVRGQDNEQNGSHEVPEASKELQAVREVRDRIAAELRRVADLLEEQPPHQAATITGQMAMLLREQTRLCQQLEALSCESSPSIYVEPAPCCSVLDAVREENRRLQNMVERNSVELKEIRKLLKELLSMKNSQH